MYHQIFASSLGFTTTSTKKNATTLTRVSDVCSSRVLMSPNRRRPLCAVAEHECRQHRLSRSASILLTAWLLTTKKQDASMLMRIPGVCSSGVFISPNSQRPLSAAGSMSAASTVMVDQFELAEGFSESTPQKASRRNSSVLGEFAEWQLL